MLDYICARDATTFLQSGRDMTREGELELTGRKVPYLNDSVACPSDKPLVPGSTATDCTHPRRPDTTRMSLHCGVARQFY